LEEQKQLSNTPANCMTDETKIPNPPNMAMNATEVFKLGRSS